MANTFLCKQLEFYADSTIGDEQWKADHDLAMFCFEVEDKISFGLTTLDRIFARINRIKTQTVDDTLRANATLWNWYLATENLLVAANPCVEGGHTLDGLDNLRARYDSVSSMLAQMGDVVESLSEIKQGKFLPLKEAMNVLRANYRPPSGLQGGTVASRAG